MLGFITGVPSQPIDLADRKSDSFIRGRLSEYLWNITCVCGYANPIVVVVLVIKRPLSSDAKTRVVLPFDWICVLLRGAFYFSREKDSRWVCPAVC